MSRCAACDRRLTEFELTRKYAGTQRYVDLCNKCFATIAPQVDVMERADLETEIIYTEAEDDDDTDRDSPDW